MKISARNVLKGKVVAITTGEVNAEVVVEVAGGTRVVAVITRSSFERLGLAEGREVLAVIKASNVMIALD